jgi:hypothetical protein
LQDRIVEGGHAWRQVLKEEKFRPGRGHCLVIREMHIKTIVKYYFTASGVAVIKVKCCRM